MNKSFFKYGLITGLIISVIIGFSFYFLFLAKPKVDVAKMNLVDLDGKKVNTQLLLEKPLVINYWATWCEPCVEELPHFEEISQKYKNEINFLFVSDEEISKIIKFKERKKLNLFFVKSPKDIGTNGVNIRPTTYFFKENGILETSKTGFIDKNTLNKLINELINK